MNEKVPIDKLFPQWGTVESDLPAILEGEVVSAPEAPTAPHVSFEDVPINHYTHDFTFFVRPFITHDSRYTNLLAILKNSQRQNFIEVEWEIGIGASNDANALKGQNTKGDSGGFFTTGHSRRGYIWNWPAVGDRVHIEGNWVWDRGHDPAATEIHPPRLIASERRLPEYIEAGTPRRFVLSTRADIFATGDGGALWNNRPSSPQFVKRVSMSLKDYAFTVSHKLPRPSPQAKLRWVTKRQAGDSFPEEPVIYENMTGDGVHVILPWKAKKVPDAATFARTVYLYWDEGIGVPSNYAFRRFRVTINDLHIKKTHDTLSDGEYRVFVQVGNNWFFINEAPGDDDILNKGIGDTGETGDNPWGVHQTFFVIVPGGEKLRIHADGWEADGVNDVFGRILDPHSGCTDRLKNWLTDNLFSEGVWANGGMDDPIGR